MTLNQQELRIEPDSSVLTHSISMLPDTLVPPVTQQINAYSFTSPTTSLLSSANTSGCMNDPYYSMYSELYHPTEHRTFVVPATGAVLLPPPSPPLAAPVSVFPFVPQLPPLPHNSDFLQSSAISNNINTFPMQQRSSLEDARMFHTTLPPPPTTTTALFGDSLNKSDIDQYLAYVESDSDCRALRVDDRRPNNNSLYMLIGEITNVKVNFTSESAIFKGFSTFNKLKPIDLTSTKINELKRIQLIKWSI
ncbi:unnamed protein product [Rotaria sp. Silwood1]|nr:unnamed protein product [Rotaria sp. Silwood1]